MEKKKLRQILIQSIKNLQKEGFIGPTIALIDLDSLNKALETSEILLRELISIYEAFGTGQEMSSKSVYARHVIRVI